MTYRVTHTTTYDYSEPVSLCHNLVHLTPRDRPTERAVHRQRWDSARCPRVVSRAASDFFGNPATFFTVQEPHQKLVVTARGTTHVNPYTPPAPPARTPPWEAFAAGLESDRSPRGWKPTSSSSIRPTSQRAQDLADYAQALVFRRAGRCWRPRWT